MHISKCRQLTLLLLLSLIWVEGRAQIDTVKKQLNHRFIINPALYLSGQYNFAYGFRIRNESWLEAGLAYQYISRGIADGLPLAPGKIFIDVVYPDPRIGLGFTGPVAFFAYTHYFLHIKRKFEQAARYDPSFETMISHALPRNSFRVQLTYKALRHSADCYYTGITESSMGTYSANKEVVKATFVWGHFLNGATDHAAVEIYYGFNISFSWGKEIHYYYDQHPYQGGNYQCVGNIHDPDVLQQEKYFRGLDLPQFKLGLRIFLQ